MSALWRINLWVCGFFTLVTLACMLLLMHQALEDVERELQSAEAVVEYLSETAGRDPVSLQPRLTASLRHVRVRWLAPDEQPQLPVQDGLDAWLGRLLFAQVPHGARLVALADGRRVQIAVDPRDEIDEVRDSLQQLLSLCALALMVSLLTIRWAVRRGMGLLEELLRALQQVSAGRLKVRLRPQGGPETRQLAAHFNRMTAALEQAGTDNARLTQALLAVQEQERTQLAQTLHDDLGQYLAGIRAQACLLRLVADRPETVKRTVRELEHNCEHLQQGFRALVHNLYPVVLQHLPLADAFALLVEQWQGRQGIDCQLRISARLPSLSAADKTHLYRLLQEALTNIARHAEASQVRVRLQHHGAHLRLLVRDNGRGAAPSRRPGVGLHSMRERARSLGGDLRIISHPGAGWALTLSMPLEAS
ncbi:ATP-binding protein [Pseudomonas sp. G(2018)]|uniref:HAMP domain-containing sensor histidine kinase n=1 Tax=Pseudomonas sp. G(2018) TaxID=2502242 RepID=UPI0010F5ED76|nr:ATP-binding protein [Pseudomonas sp. G(2018)]